MTDREQVRVIVVSDHRRGTVHGLTNDYAEAQQWIRELIAKYGGDNLAAGMTAGLVDVPTPETAARVRTQVAHSIAAKIEETYRILGAKPGSAVADIAEMCADIARQHAAGPSGTVGNPEEPQS